MKFQVKVQNLLIRCQVIYKKKQIIAIDYYKKVIFNNKKNYLIRQKILNLQYKRLCYQIGDYFYNKLIKLNKPYISIF